MIQVAPFKRPVKKQEIKQELYENVNVEDEMIAFLVIIRIIIACNLCK
jgi:hypothetical protein